MDLTALIWIVGLITAGYLAYHKREGWGWIIFILACSGGDFGSSDEKAFKKEVSSLKKEVAELQMELSTSVVKPKEEVVKIVKEAPKGASSKPNAEWKETKDRW